ncbi:MAG: biphenyl-2,3-diol 1,2-dioxygenase [marine bacterium B5-7]|nr:MAG: biphenyl-2,3-diol 1,2-dioxygenase [marine bacterium B5-7]
MIELRNIHYLRIGTRDLDGAERFCTEVVGLQKIERNENALYLRSDNRHHTLCYFDGEADDHTVGFELSGHKGLDRALDTLDRAGVTCGRGTTDEAIARYVHSFGWFNDPSGNRIELLVRPFEANRRFFPARDSGVTGFGHIGLNSTDTERDEDFWTTHFNARVSDWIGKAPLIRVASTHHQLALFPSEKSGIQHINHQVAEVDDIMRSWYLLQDQGIRIVFGPGRHCTSGGYFLYFEGHDDMVFEYSNSDRLIIEDDSSYRPRQFAMEYASFCAFGSKPDVTEFS